MPEIDTTHPPLVEPDVRISRIRLSRKRSPVGNAGRGLDPVIPGIKPAPRLLLDLLAQLLSQLRKFLRQATGRDRPRFVRSGMFIQAAFSSSYRNVFPVRPLGSAVVTRFLATMSLSDSRAEPPARLCLSGRRWGHWPHSVGSPRFLDRSVPARCPLSPRSVRRVLALVTSPPMAGFISSGRLATLIWCNEAELGSLPLRLAGSPSKASPAGFLRLTLGWLHVERAIVMVNTSQLTRSARLGLAHQMHTEKHGFNLC